MDTAKKIPVTVPEMVSIIKDAKELINTPEKWGKGASAFNSAGNVVSYKDTKAVCFCITGAIIAAREKFEKNNKNRLIFNEKIYDLFPTEFLGQLYIFRDKGCQLIEFNDNLRTSHEQVMHLFNITIERNS